MSLVNFTTREITCKIVYYGPGRSGKTTNLQYVYGRVPESRRGRMVSLATQTDRTLFFDFLPLELGTISGFTTRFQLYTVPGQSYYNATRKLVLQGADVRRYDSLDPHLIDDGVRDVEGLLGFLGVNHHRDERVVVIEVIGVLAGTTTPDLPLDLALRRLVTLVGDGRVVEAFAFFDVPGENEVPTFQTIGRNDSRRFNSPYERLVEGRGVVHRNREGRGLHRHGIGCRKRRRAHYLPPVPVAISSSSAWNSRRAARMRSSTL